MQVPGLVVLTNIDANHMKSESAIKLKDLITQGKEAGFPDYAQVNDHLPDDIVDPEQDPKDIVKP